MQALGQGARLGEQPGQRLEARFGAGGIEHRGDDGAGLGILIGDEIEQRPGAEQDAAPADGAALRLQRDLRAAQREDAGQRPAGDRDDPIHGARRQDQPVIGQGVAAGRAGDMHHAP